MTRHRPLPEAYTCCRCGETFRPNAIYRTWWGIDRCADCATRGLVDEHGRWLSTTGRARVLREGNMR